MVNHHDVQTALCSGCHAKGDFFCHRQRCLVAGRRIKDKHRYGDPSVAALFFSFHDISFFPSIVFPIERCRLPRIRDLRCGVPGNRYLVAFISPATDSPVPDSQPKHRKFLFDGPSSSLRLFRLFSALMCRDLLVQIPNTLVEG